jgi:hypothetical protein
MQVLETTRGKRRCVTLLFATVVRHSNNTFLYRSVYIFLHSFGTLNATSCSAETKHRDAEQVPHATHHRPRDSCPRSRNPDSLLTAIPRQARLIQRGGARNRELYLGPQQAGADLLPMATTRQFNTLLDPEEVDSLKLSSNVVWYDISAKRQCVLHCDSDFATPNPQPIHTFYPSILAAPSTSIPLRLTSNLTIVSHPSLALHHHQNRNHDRDLRSRTQ